MNTEFLTTILSFVAIVIAVWQGKLSKDQLEQSKQTKSDTEKLIEDIKQRVSKIEYISDETRRDVKEQIAKLIDKQDENFKTLLNAPKENSQYEMMMALIPQVLSNPELLDKFVNPTKQNKSNTNTRTTNKRLRY
jgi:gas vesicle protein